MTDDSLAKLPEPDPSPAPKPSRGRGRGRGGRGRGAGTVSEKDTNTNVKATPKAKAKVPFLLTNLVRTGNQMGSSSSWKIIQKSLRQTIASRLQIEPLSSKAVGDAQLHLNRSILVMLGKILPSDDHLAEPSGLRPSQALCDSAAELLQILDI